VGPDTQQELHFQLHGIHAHSTTYTHKESIVWKGILPVVAVPVGEGASQDVGWRCDAKYGHGMWKQDVGNFPTRFLCLAFNSGYLYTFAKKVLS
jgi:hypothetical protein